MTDTPQQADRPARAARRPADPRPRLAAAGGRGGARGDHQHDLRERRPPGRQPGRGRVDHRPARRAEHPRGRHHLGRGASVVRPQAAHRAARTPSAPSAPTAACPASRAGARASTTSTAPGTAAARSARPWAWWPAGIPGRVVAVIGDGALTGGMAYEALNHAGHLGTPVLVILNDNTMSIEKNVGAMSTYLSRLRTEPDALPLPARHGAAAAEAARRGRPDGRHGRAAEGQHQGGPRAGHALRGPGLHLRGRHRRTRHRGAAGQHPALAGGRGPGAAALPDGQGQGLRAGREAARPLSRHAAVLGGDRQEPRPRGTHHLHPGVRRGGGGAGPQRRAHRGHHRGHGLGDRTEPAAAKLFPTGSSTWASPRPTRWLSPPGWRPPASGRSWPSTPPSCSGPTTRSSTTCACRACRWCSPSTGPAWWARTGPRITAPSTSPSCASSPGSPCSCPRTRRNCSACWPPLCTLDGPSVIRYPALGRRGRAVWSGPSSRSRDLGGGGPGGRRRAAAHRRARPRSGPRRPRTCWRGRASRRPWPASDGCIRSTARPSGALVRGAPGRGHRGGQRAGGRLRLGHPRVHVGGGPLPPDRAGWVCPMPSSARAPCELLRRDVGLTAAGHRRRGRAAGRERRLPVPTARVS